MKLPELIKNVVGSADEHQAFMHVFLHRRI